MLANRTVELETARFVGNETHCLTPASFYLLGGYAKFINHEIMNAINILESNLNRVALVNRKLVGSKCEVRTRNRKLFGPHRNHSAHLNIYPIRVCLAGLASLFVCLRRLFSLRSLIRLALYNPPSSTSHYHYHQYRNNCLVHNFALAYN